MQQPAGDRAGAWAGPSGAGYGFGGIVGSDQHTGSNAGEASGAPAGGNGGSLVLFNSLDPVEPPPSSSEVWRPFVASPGAGGRYTHDGPTRPQDPTVPGFAAPVQVSAVP